MRIDIYPAPGNARDETDHTTGYPPSGDLEAAPKPASSWTRRRAATCSVAAAVAGILVTAAVAAWWPSDSPAPQQSGTSHQEIKDAVDKAVQDALEDQPREPSSIYAQVAPSLVYIEATKPAAGANGKDSVGVGAGVIVTSGGVVLTALHVVDGAQTIQLTFADGSRSSADVVSTDPTLDIATLAPSTLPSTIVPAVIGSAATLAPGDAAVAIGHPLGLADSVTSGVISGLNRSLPATEKAGALDRLIQFDAAVNPGSSGGPLLNGRGEIVGIVVALADPSGDGYFVGIAFAIPIDLAVGGSPTGGGPQK